MKTNNKLIGSRGIYIVYEEHQKALFLKLVFNIIHTYKHKYMHSQKYINIRLK